MTGAVVEADSQEGLRDPGFESRSVPLWFGLVDCTCCETWSTTPQAGKVSLDTDEHSQKLRSVALLSPYRPGLVEAGPWEAGGWPVSNRTVPVVTKPGPHSG